MSLATINPTAYVQHATVHIRRDVLKAWLELSGVNHVWLANQLHVTKGRISQILHSDVSPSARLIGGLLLVTQLPFDRLFQVVHSPIRIQSAIEASPRIPETMHVSIA